MNDSDSFFSGTGIISCIIFQIFVGLYQKNAVSNNLSHSVQLWRTLSLSTGQVFDTVVGCSMCYQVIALMTFTENAFEKTLNLGRSIPGCNSYI